MSGIEFTEDQKAAILSHSSMVITACPGSGKTTVVAEKIRNEVEELPLYRGVIGITFTVKASKELKAKCKKDLCDTKSSFFGTIDGFCLSEIVYPFFSRVIERKKSHLKCIGFNTVSSDIKEKLSVLPDYDEEINSNSFDLFQHDIEVLFDNGIILLELIGLVANHVVSKSIACQKYISAKYNSVYMDEYQDSSEPQHALFLKMLSLGLTCVAVGDVQQSIYAWRNSRPEFIEELTNNVGVFEHHVININHRCHPSIINYSNRLYNSTCDLLPVDSIRVHRRNYPGTQVDVTEGLNESIKSAMKNKVVESYSQIGILVRGNLSLEFLGNGLNVPFRVFDEDPLAVSNTEISKLFSQFLKYRFDSQYHMYDVIEYIETFSPLDRKGLAQVRELISTLDEKDNEELSLAIIEVVEELLSVVVSDSDKELINSICIDSSLLKHYKPINEDEVQVMTIHKSKGLEFELVYHLDLYDWIHPRRKYVKGCYDVVYDNWEQELNLHFVGITRAKEHCVLVTSGQRFNRDYEVKQGNPSQFFSMPGLAGLYRHKK